jgi:CubicO group peptidase (beta-lactamase class C family)
MRSLRIGLVPGLGVVLAACGGQGAARQPVAAPPPTAATAPVLAAASPAAPAPAPAPTASVEQVFAHATPPSVFTDPERRAKLAAAFPSLDKALEQERAAQGLPGVAVGVVIDGELAYAKGFGVVDPKTKTVPDADTVYRIGSISKSFTGLALLSLRDEGVLDLDDPLARWIPEASKIVYPTRDERPITLRQLALHTSGLPRMGPFEPENGPDEATVVGSLAKITLDRAPGLESVYSNLGFSLLGIVVSHAAKRPLHDVVASRIFTPLGMTSSGWDAASVPAGHLAPAFTKGPDAGAVPPARLGAADGAGGIYSSVRDMARYAAFLLAAYPPRDDDDRGPIRRATIREAQLSGFALEPHVALPPNAKAGAPRVELDASTYGFGWVHRQTCSATDLVWHNGAIDSYRSHLALRTASGIGVVVLTNFGNANTEAFANRALEILEATGAMKPREAATSEAFTATMKTFLEVYNDFDATKLQSILNRPIDPREHEELAGYKALHGTCTGFKPAKMVTDRAARFAFTCERGALEIEANFDGAGKIGGFIGRSPGVTPPANVAKVFTAALALHVNGAWNEAAYKVVFPKQQIPEAQARTVAAQLKKQLGTCKPGAFMHEGFGWTLDLRCTKGAPLALTIQFDAHGDLEGIQFHPPAGAEPQRCPAR